MSDIELDEMLNQWGVPPVRAELRERVQAGFVAAAYLQAQDTTQYNFWKSIESVDCSAAGMPGFSGSGIGTQPYRTHIAPGFQED